MESNFAEVKISYKSDKRFENLPEIRDPDSAATLLRKLWDKKTIELREEFIVLLLNTAKKCIGWHKISIGGMTATVVDPAVVFKVALLGNAHSLVLAHNHPSGNSNASQPDIYLTRKIVEAGRVIGITVEDHIILCPNGGFTSMRSKGLI
jgi:DNA repair protein RadC